MDIHSDILLPAISELNSSLEAHQQIAENEDAPLFGGGGPLDSLALVNLTLLIEEKIKDVAQRDVRLVSDKALSMKNSPFRSTAALAQYIADILDQ